MAKKIGEQTIVFDEKISISQTASVVGPMEGQGLLGNDFDLVVSDDCLGESTFEKGECMMLKTSIDTLMRKGKFTQSDIDIIIGGDLLNQLITTTFTALNYDMMYWGIYSACASFAQALQIGSTAIESGAVNRVIACTSSHFSTAERQYRTPLELGSQSKSTAQRTVTGAGCVSLEKGGSGPYITHMTIGKIVDFDQKDAANMGTAMAPAAAHTILRHFRDTGTSFDDYDMVYTGDLAKIGLDILTDILTMEGYNPCGRLNDCGHMIYDTTKQHAETGGSGAGCSSSVFAGHIYRKLKNKELEKILFVPTGALLSTVSSYQKNSIPSIAHAVVISNKKGKQNA
ncbi:MAG: stage V sporulation protein AD [Anaerofustis stercorihominis]|nr:stage V sporulation protein AD [Anaerofustis stercorihominis]